MFRLFTLLADVVAYGWLGLDPATRTAAAVHFFVEDVTKIFALLLTVIFVMGLFRSMLSPERVRTYLGKDDRGGRPTSWRWSWAR